jgi:hypothetical protein
MQTKIRLFCCLGIFFASLLVSPSCSKKEKPVVVVPGRSIAGVELSMSRDQVISVLGKPGKAIFPRDIEQLGQFRELGKGPFTEEIPRMSVLVYSTPPLFVSLHENDKVGPIQLGYTKSVLVEGYDFLQFKYLAKEEVERIGKPSSVIRDEASEQQMLSTAPEGTKIEYYVYVYDQPRLTLGFVFDRTKEKSSRYFIGLNYIAVSAGKVLP